MRANKLLELVCLMFVIYIGGNSFGVAHGNLQPQIIS